LLIRASDEATPAAYAHIRIHPYYTVIPFCCCSRGAHIHARGLLAVIAENWVDELLYGGISTHLPNEDLGVKYTWREKMFLFAADHTIVTPYACLQVNHHSPSGHCVSSYLISWSNGVLECWRIGF
jgi:hypothetical protein